MLSQLEPYAYKCEQGHWYFLNPAPTASIIFIDGDEIVLSRRGIDPNKGLIDCFGGFMNPAETVEEAAKREIEEETGLKPDDYGDLHYIGSYHCNYEFGGEPAPVISMFYYTDLKPGTQFTPGDDCAEVVRMKPDEIDWTVISGEDTKQAIKAMQQLKHI